MTLLASSARFLCIVGTGALCFFPFDVAQDSPQTPSPSPAVESAAPVRAVRRATQKLPTAAESANTILLDPAHGGADAGARFSNLLEKDLTLALAERLRPMLVAQGFTVVLAREASSEGTSGEAGGQAQVPSEDQRTEQANRLHPLACLLLHVSNGGHGIHLFTSALSAVSVATEPHAIAAWNVAQAASLTESLRLATDLSTAMNGSRIPLVLGRASVQPIDSLTCPAVTVEMAALPGGTITDVAYQDRVAGAITSALAFYRGHTETEAARSAAAEQAARAATKASGTSSPPAKPTRRRSPVQAPAPVVRTAPADPTAPGGTPDISKPTGVPQ